MDGAYHESYGVCYNDVESAVLGRLIPVDVYNVNHHGSIHSSSDNFTGIIQPTVSVFSCGADNSYGHPHQGVVDKLLAYGDVYFTENGNEKTDIGTGVVSQGDIFLSTSKDGKRYTVTAGNVTVEYVSKGSTFPDSVSVMLPAMSLLVSVVLFVTASIIL